MRGFKKILSSEWIVVIFLFLVAAGIRLIPEIKAGIWPIGYDTSNTYAAEITSYHGPLINFLKTANLLYFFFLPFKAFGISPEMIMKIFGPLLFSGLVLSFYFFCRKFIKFDKIKSLIILLLFIFQLAALRLSWDLYRNELGLIFLLFGLIYLPEIKKTKNLIFISLAAVLVTLSNELATVLFLIILFIDAIYLLFKRDWEGSISVLIPLVASSAIFVIVINSSGQVLYDPHVFFTGEKNYFWRYFYRYDALMSYKYLSWLIGSLFWLLYGFLLPLAILGFWKLKKNIVLMTMVIWLLFGTFSSLLFFGKGIIVWERWMFMLVFPLVIFTVEGAFWLGKLVKIKWLALTLAIIFWTVYLGFFISRAWPFLTANYIDVKPPLANDELNSYFPRTMILNSIGINETADTVKAIEWLDNDAPSGSVILVDNRYRGMMITHFKIDDRYIITNPWSETIQSSNLEAVKKTNYWPIYLIWNISKAVPGFDRVNNFGNRGIYKALPEFREQ